MLAKRPLFSSQLPTQANERLARLGGLEGASRAFLVGVLPLVALETFGDKQTISLVYLASAMITLLFSLNIASLERLLKRRRLVTLGGLFLVIAAFLFYQAKAFLFAFGVGLQAAEASILSVCLSLYVMDYIGKNEFTRAESRRMVYNGLAWLLAPISGIWLYENSSIQLVYLIAMFLPLLMLGYFWHLRLGDSIIITKAKSTPPNPLKSVKRYFSQPCLCIAYITTLSRSCYWHMLFVYGPIYVVESGLPAWIGGAILSSVSGLLFFSPMIQRLADRFGTRQVLLSGSLVIGCCLFALGFLGEPRAIGLSFFLLAAAGAATMDVLGNIPFMRMVKQRERIEMTMVFSTWREASSLLTQVLATLTLLVAPFWVFFFILGILNFSAAVSLSYLPRRL